MTTTRDLIQRLANALHDAAEDVGCWGSYASGYFQEKHDLSGNIAKIHAQAKEAHAYLSQPEPEGLTLDCDDIDVPPWHRGDDFYVYKEGYEAGWSDAALAADRARWGRPTVEPPAKPSHNTAQHGSQLQ